MISKHSANLTPQPSGIRTWLWRYTYLLLLISMLWHRQAIFESKGHKLSSSAECRIRTQRVSETQSSADYMPADKPTELSRIKLKKLELDSPSLWSASTQPIWPHCHLAFAPGSGDIHICCCSFRCSGTGKRFSNRKETSCLPLLNAGFESRGSLKPNIQQTECLLTNRLSYWGSSLKKTWTPQPIPMISKHSAHLTPLPFGIRTWLWRYTYFSLFILMLWYRQAVFESKGDKLSSSAECRIRTQRVSETQSSADWMPADKLTELSRIKLKKLELDSPSLWSASTQPIWPHSHLAFAPGSGDIHICCC